MADPFSFVHDAINDALDGLRELPDTAHGRESGQVEYKLNEAKLWLGVVPGAIAAITGADRAPEQSSATVATTEVPATEPVPRDNPPEVTPAPETPEPAASTAETASAAPSAPASAEAPTDPTQDVPIP